MSAREAKSMETTIFENGARVAVVALDDTSPAQAAVVLSSISGACSGCGGRLYHVRLACGDEGDACGQLLMRPN